MNPGRLQLPGAGRALPRTAILGLLLALFLGLTIAAAPGTAEAKWKIEYEKVATVRGPTAVVAAPGHRKMIFVTQRNGKIRMVRHRRVLPRPFLDISDRVSTTAIEQGLLGLAFPPDYQKTGHFYVDYTDRKGHIRIDQFTRSRKNRLYAPVSSRRPVLRIPRMSQSGNHNGGEIKFLGGLLYIAVGDGNDPGDSQNLAQNLYNLHGKILRIDPRADETTGRSYRIPPTNPFANRPGRGEIFAYGLRNPHSFDFYRPPDGKLQMVISDVGQYRFEEINYLPFANVWGANFGWKFFEGIQPYDCEQELCPSGAPVTTFPPLVWPVLTYNHKAGCAVIGGPVIEDTALTSIRGRLIYGDFCRNRVRTAAPNSGWITDDRPLGTAMPPGHGEHPALNGIGEDAWGRVYLFSNFGQIYRLEQTAVPKVKKKPKKNKRKTKKKSGGNKNT